MLKILALSSLLALVGCATSTPKPLTIQEAPVASPSLSLADPDPIALEPFTAHVIVQGSKHGQYGNVGDLYKTSNSSVLFALTPEDYGTLQVDLVKIRAYIESLKAQTNAYKQYYGKNK